MIKQILRKCKRNVNDEANWCVIVSIADITANAMEKQMGSLNKESFEEFLESLKQAGIDIINEREVRERLGEVRSWRDAFSTIARHCDRIGISFKCRNGTIDQTGIHRAFAAYQLPEQVEKQFAANLEANL
jgi:hypothetical protein